MKRLSHRELKSLGNGISAGVTSSSLVEMRSFLGVLGIACQFALIWLVNEQIELSTSFHKNFVFISVEYFFYWYRPARWDSTQLNYQLVSLLSVADDYNNKKNIWMFLFINN